MHKSAIMTHAHQIFDSAIGVVEAGTHRPLDMLTLEAHLAESVDRALKSRTGQEAGSKSCRRLLFSRCCCGFRSRGRGGRSGNWGRGNGSNRFRCRDWRGWLGGSGGDGRGSRLGLVHA